MNSKYLFALRSVRQVNEEQLIETAFANQLRRQRRNIVAGRGYEYRGLAVLHPGKKGCQDARGDSCIYRSRIWSASGKDLFQFINPEYAGCKSFGDAKHFLNSFFSLSDVLVENSCGIEFNQRQVPLTGNGPSTHALATTLHAKNYHSSRRLQAKLSRGVFPRPAPLRQPAFQVVQTANCRQIFRCINELQHTRMT